MLTLTEIYRMFKQEGREIEFEVRRGQEKSQIKIRLRRLA